MQQLDRSEIDVEIELESQTQQDVARMLVAGHARIAQSAEEDRVDIVPKVFECGAGKGLFGSEIVVGGIGQAFPRQREVMLRSGAVEDGNRCFDHLRPDPVSPNDGDGVPLHSKPVPRPQLRQ